MLRNLSNQGQTMNFQLQSPLVAAKRRLPFECVTLLLQGGGALGAYQGGVYEALAESNIHPDWIAGISIGAINGAIIAGNPPESRVDRLREFWTQVTSSATWDWSSNPIVDLSRSDITRNLLNQISANLVASFGSAGFFSARPLMPWLQPGGTLEATSFYDTKSLRGTLERLVDFDRINAGMTRFSAGAVNVRQLRLFRQHHPYHQARACHGKRRAPTRLSRRRDRGRAVLGRRPRLQYAAAVGN
jgi:NTE family protein